VLIFVLPQARYSISGLDYRNLTCCDSECFFKHSFFHMTLWINWDRWVTVFAGRRQRDLLQILPKHGDFLRWNRVRGQMHGFAMVWRWHGSGEIVLGETGKSRWPDCSKLSEHSAFHGWIPKKTSLFCIFAISIASSSTSPRGAKRHQEWFQQLQRLD